MSGKHTQGPWVGTYSAGSDGFEGLSIMAGDVLVVGACGCCGSPFGDNAADASLITAVPDLLESLRDMVDWLDDGNRQLSDNCAADITKARAAIAKATGEAS